MSDSNRVRLSYIEETTWGTTPSGNLQIIRYTGEGLKGSTESSASNEVRDDRQETDVIRTFVSGGGPINIEASYGSFDDFLRLGLQSAAWSSAVAVGPVATIDFGAPSGGEQTVSDSGSGFGSLAANRWVKISGASSAGNNGYFKIKTASAGSITIYNSGGASEAAGASVTIKQGEQIVNGTTRKSLTVEKYFTDLSNEYAVYRGQCVNQIALTVASRQIMTGRFELLGKKEESATASVGSGYTNANTNSILNAVDDVESILENRTKQGSKQLDFTLNNNLRFLDEVGTLGPTEMGSGSIELTGNLQTYFKSSSLLDKYLGWTKTSLATVVRDAAGNGYVFDFPRIRYTDGQRLAEGKNGDVMAQLQWRAYRHETEGVTLRIARFPAA